MKSVRNVKSIAYGPVKGLVTAAVFLLCTGAVHAQEMSHTSHKTVSIAEWFALAELPFLLMAMYFAFRSARAFRGGVLGSGMVLLAWGFLVMGIGHLHMQVEHFYGVSIFGMLFGKIGGIIAWVVALMVTWTLSSWGFYKIYKAAGAK